MPWNIVGLLMIDARPSRALVHPKLLANVSTENLGKLTMFSRWVDYQQRLQKGIDSESIIRKELEFYKPAFALKESLQV